MLTDLAVQTLVSETVQNTKNNDKKYLDRTLQTGLLPEYRLHSFFEQLFI